VCRLFGVISSKNIDPGYGLTGAKHSLLFQSRVSRNEIQKDGWGLGWFSGKSPKVYKSPKPIYQELGLKRRLARTTFGKNDVRSRCLIGHARWASNPLKLPRHRLIGKENSQPFIFQRWIFAHNGTLLIPKEVREALGPFRKYIRGQNDSEVLFYWLMKYLRAPLTRGSAAGILSSLRRSFRDLDRIWDGCRKRHPLYKYPYHGVNWVLTDGKILLAMCYVNRGGFGKAKALCGTGAPYYQLHYKHHGKDWTIASEPLDDDPRWRSFSHGQLLIASSRKGQFYQALHVRPT
jgi:predicted glutamine amidotransferase